jgi:hypothetical protein
MEGLAAQRDWWDIVATRHDDDEKLDMVILKVDRILAPSS